MLHTNTTILCLFQRLEDVALDVPHKFCVFFKMFEVVVLDVKFFSILKLVVA